MTITFRKMHLISQAGAYVLYTTFIVFYTTAAFFALQTTSNYNYALRMYAHTWWLHKSDLNWLTLNFPKCKMIMDFFNGVVFLPRCWLYINYEYIGFKLSFNLNPEYSHYMNTCVAPQIRVYKHLDDSVRMINEEE